MDDITRLYNASVESLEEVHDINSALSWADGFRFPLNIASKHTDKWKNRRPGTTFTNFVRSLQQPRVHNRFNTYRVKLLCRDSPEFDKLLDLAKGITILTGDNFSPVSSSIPLRKRYIELSTVCNKSLYDLYLRNELIVFDKSVLPDIHGAHLSSVHWTFKKGKPQGRVLIDPSNGNLGHNLNSPESKASCILRYGKLSHPTVEDFTRVFHTFAELNGWDRVTLWKVDLKNAFGLLDIKSNSVALNGFELTDNLIAFHTVGYFGYTGLPMAFGIVTREVVRLINFHLSGLTICNGYVDDFGGICLESDVQLVLQRVKEIACSLLGPTALEDKKTAHGRVLELIGWSFSLNERSVSISTKNFNLILNAFIKVDTTSLLSTSELQRFASWSQRYSKVCELLQPFSILFSIAHRGYGQTHSSITLTPEVIVAFYLWKVTLLLIADHKISTTIPMATLLPTEHCDYWIGFDGFPGGIGFTLFNKAPSSGDDTSNLIGWGSYLLPYHLTKQNSNCLDSSFQNTSEIMAASVATFTLGYLLSATNVTVRYIGDSVTALMWLRDHRYRGGPSLRSTIALTMAHHFARIKTHSTLHVAGKSNTINDELSRGITRPSLLLHHSQLEIRSPRIQALLCLLNPLSPFTSVNDFSELLDLFLQPLPS